jgi:hypothetical protein
VSGVFLEVVGDTGGGAADVFSAMVPKIADYRRRPPGERDSLFDRMAHTWRTSRATMFRTQGRSTGTPWPTYDQTGEADWYVFYKSIVLDRAIGALDLLRWDGTDRMFRSMTDRTHPWHIDRREPARITLGTRHPGAHQTQTGTGRAPSRLGGHPIPRRPLLGIGDATRQNWREDLIWFARAWGAELGEQLTRAQAGNLPFARGRR